MVHIKIEGNFVKACRSGKTAVDVIIVLMWTNPIIPNSIAR